MRKGRQTQLSLYLSAEAPDGEEAAILREFEVRNKRRRGGGQSLLREALLLGWRQILSGGERASAALSGDVGAAPPSSPSPAPGPTPVAVPLVADTSRQAPKAEKAPPPASGKPRARIGKLFT